MQADVAVIKMVRASVGNSVNIRLDANRSWNLVDAIEFCTQVRDLNIEFIEEPCQGLGAMQRYDSLYLLPQIVFVSSYRVC